MKYFTIQELSHSNTADRLRIKNIPNQVIISRLTELVNHVLDPLREWYGKPVRISSGYRCPELNKAVGGVKNSQHQYGYAADIDVGSRIENQKLFNYIKEHLPFDQLIDEKHLAWVHVSYRSDGQNRKQVICL